jgi:hypothetical protein
MIRERPAGGALLVLTAVALSELPSPIQLTPLPQVPPAPTPPPQSELPSPVQLTLHPQGPRSPALKYHLLPELAEQKPGDAGPLYRRVAQAVEKLRGKGEGAEQSDEQLAKWQKMPLNELPRTEVRRFLDNHLEVFQTLEQAARCEYCDWGFVRMLRQKGISALLSEIQPSRKCANLLAVRARLALAEGKLDQAFRDLQTGFALARHLGEAPTLICLLVETAVAGMMLDQLEEFIQQAQAPNLYWTLTDLPRPFIDTRKALQGERVMVYGTFPGLGEAAGNLSMGPLSEPQAQELAKFIRNNPSENWVQDFLDRMTLSRQILANHEDAKRVLIEHGRPRELVEAMPHVQVAVLHALHEYDRLMDEFIKWQSFPYWEARPHFRRLRKEQDAELKNKDKSFALTLVGLLLPAAEKVVFSRTRVDRRIAALRCVEALRLHAAANGGKLPALLGDIKEVPIPVDPVTGKNFEYQVMSGKATLYGPPPGKEPPGFGNALTLGVEASALTWHVIPPRDTRRTQGKPAAVARSRSSSDNDRQASRSWSWTSPVIRIREP